MQRRAFEELPATRALRRTVVPMLVVAGILALLSGFRAIVQVFDLEVRVSTQSPSLRAGSG